MNQLDHLNLMDGLNPETVATIPNYNDASLSAEERARAYLDINCAHCHNLDAWERPAREDRNLRYAPPLAETGIVEAREDLENALVDEEMPFIGTSVAHSEGVALVLDYLASLN